MSILRLPAVIADLTRPNGSQFHRGIRMTLSGLIVFALALLVAAGSPGPSIAALVARVLTNGLRDVLPFLVAMWLGEVLWLTAAVTGLAVVAETFHGLFVALKVAGVLYLLYLAWTMWTTPADPAGVTLPTGQRPWRMFAGGLVVTLGNPKIMVFYLALLPTLIDVHQVGFAAWGQLVATMLVVLAGIDLAWALLAARARRLLRSPRAVRLVNRTSASAMAGAAAAIAAK
jgi:threonine/homoserine/homoserine lactone efflux protein